ncbi:divalent-cation tolerance protein CutA [Natronoglycomyces albus]|uniref:Divalent-cation tolerance protein CutA n=1 Tax=Natronoglycomyces albus TaxID=2811108 RepID=A0A895XLB8_9ACTN|nr:divalent-cation tolerance protein CutA [Natronoglycomyces albus]QSB05867.1 divalent-cation tolerance protein CutA [Natronoglycomyces albus]
MDSTVTANIVEIVVTCPSPESASELAELLIQERLAACAQSIQQVMSIYRWEGRVENEPEARLAIHTSARLVEEVRAAVDQFHPYDLPCFLVFDVRTSPGYAAWVAEEVK